jgi:death-on-curing protein
VAEVYYLELGDFCLIAAEVMGTTPDKIARLPRIGLAASALAVPSSGFGDQDAYVTLLDKAAALIEHLARNHPLPDGNKRCAFLSAERSVLRRDPQLAGSPDSNRELSCRPDDHERRRIESFPRYT